MEKLEVLITDFENNPRQQVLAKPEYSRHGRIVLVKSIMEDLGIKQDFENYVLITHTGENITYTFNHGGEGITAPLYPPSGKGKELEEMVGNTIYTTFENPHVIVSDRKLFGKKIGERRDLIKSDIDPNKTLLAVDYRFEDAALYTLDLLGIATDVHYDYRQLELF